MYRAMHTMWSKIIDQLKDYADIVAAAERQRQAATDPELMRPLAGLCVRLQAEGVIEGDRREGDGTL